ncbi:MAG: hypothetical protein KF680_00145 [Cryobacterium sp.]|nr:hypothetical protein [Cryobacterium sp.]
MASAERMAWQYGLIAIAGYSVYLGLILSQAGSSPLVEVDYVWPMVWTIGGAIVGAIVLSILVAMFFPKDAGKEDVRDKEIGRFGDNVGNGFVVAGALAALVMALLEWDHFWIANVIYLGFVLSGILSSIARIAAYRWGFQR